jgi:IclR family transcriptional regulator, KDG regulon repressor
MVERNSSDTARYRVQSVERALQLLGAFNQDERQLALADLAERVGIPRPTAFRLLSTLEAQGFVRRVGTDYCLGFRCFVLGNVVKADLAIEREALPFLEALRDVTGETTQLGILDGWQVVYLARVFSHLPVAYMRSRVGVVLPAYCTGLGKALLAELPPEEVERWSRTQHFPRLTSATLTSPEELLANLAVIRRRGYALDQEEREVGVACIAAVVRDDTGSPVAAISAAGPVDRLPRDLEGSEMATRVVTAAAGISERLGYVAQRTVAADTEPDPDGVVVQ